MNLKDMTAPQLVKAAIIQQAIEWDATNEHSFAMVDYTNIDEVYDTAKSEEILNDCDQEVRCSGIETHLPCPTSRHYECDAVAIRVGDKWVGFNYWYGGGKHGQPETIDWIDSAYFVKATPKVVTAYDFEVEV